MINGAVIHNFEDNTHWGIITDLLHGKRNMYVYKRIILSILGTQFSSPCLD